METDIVCSSASVNACFPLGSGGAAEVDEEDDELTALKDLASDECYLCKLDELFEEDWD